MARKVHAGIAALAVALAGAAHADIDSWRAQVFAAERAFANTMAERDHAAFARLVSREALFFGAGGVLRGRAQVAEGWKAFFDQPAAPFSWEPDTVEVIASGRLALSSGPVRDPAGKVIARFNSIWRQESPGVWRVLFDKGEPVRE